MNPQLRRVTAQQGTADPHRAPGPEPLVRDISTDWPNRETRDDADQLLAPTNVRTSAAQPTDTLLVADGTRLQLRPIGSDDRDQVAALFARLTPESRYRRFLSPKRELTPRELTFFTDIDHTNHEAIAAVDPHDGSIVGVGPLRPLPRQTDNRRPSHRGRRRAAKHGDRHDTRQTRRASRPRQRRCPTHRHHALGEPARARAVATPRIPRPREPRPRNRARAQARTVQPPRSGTRARKPASDRAGSHRPLCITDGGTDSRITASDLRRHTPVHITPTERNHPCPHTFTAASSARSSPSYAREGTRGMRHTCCAYMSRAPTSDATAVLGGACVCRRPLLAQTTPSQPAAERNPSTVRTMAQSGAVTCNSNHLTASRRQ